MKRKYAVTALLLVLVVCVFGLIACTQNVKLSAPKITLDGNVVRWSAVEHADAYEVTVGSDNPVEVKDTSYTVNKVELGSYDITVVATSTESKYLTSDKSNKVTYVVEKKVVKLNAPTATLQTNVVSWSAVSNAMGYKVIVGNDEPVTLPGSVTSYTVDKTAVGSYEIKVIATTTADGYADSDAAVAGTLTIVEPSLQVNVNSVKDVYFLDDGITTLDLTGLTATYTDMYGKTTDVDVKDLKVSDYDLTVANEEIAIVFTYNNVNSKNKLYIEVKERGLSDINDYTERLLQYNATGKYDLGGATTAVNMKGESIVDGGKMTLPVGKTLVKLDGNYVVVTVAYFVSSVQDFKDIAKDMSGYYLLTKNIDFENAPQSPIGAAPIRTEKVGDESTHYPDVEKGGNADGQIGVPFTGTFDGQGYALQNYSLSMPEGVQPYNAGAYGMAIFGWVGKGGEIKNLVLRNVSVSGGKYCSLLAGANEGVISDICVEASCAVKCTYGGGAAICSYNYGTISNVVSHVAKYVGFQDAEMDLPLATTSDVAYTVENGFIDKDNHTDVLGGNWHYYEGVGTMLANADYVLIPVGNSTLTIGKRLYLHEICGSGNDISIRFIGDKAGEIHSVWDNEKGTHYIEIADLATTTIVAGDKVQIKLISGNGKYFDIIEVTFTPAVVVGYVKDSDNLTPVEGTELVLNEINITEIYSDNSTKTVHPVKVEDYDKNGAVGVAQTVKAFYGDGENDYVEITVTPQAKSVTGIALKDGVSYKQNYMIGVDTALDLNAVVIVVSYNNGTTADVDVTAEMVDETSYNLTVANVYNVKVSYGGSDTTFPITVQSAEIDGITLVGTFGKTVYKINETVVASDFAGVTITAHYTDNTENSGIAITSAMLSYDFSVAGDTDITVTYQEMTATVAVTVVDYVTALIVTPSSTTIVYSSDVALNIGANATYALQMASGGDPVSVDVSQINISEVKAGHVTVTYAYSDEYSDVSTDVEYDIWYELGAGEETAAQALDVIRGNMSGLYRLTHSLVFEGWQSPIGAAPIKVEQVGSESSNLPDIENGGSADGQIGVPFTGTLDGQGYAIQNFKMGLPDGVAPFNAGAYGMAIFGWVGKGGEIKNLVLRNVSVSGGKFCSLLAGVNEGVISNICVEATCSLTCTYSGGSAICSYNYGTITNVVSHVAKYVGFQDAEMDLPLATTSDVAYTVENGFIDKDNHTDVLGDGWKYYEGVGTLLANADYVLIPVGDSNLAIGTKLYLNGIFMNGDAVSVAVFGEKKDEIKVGWDNAVGSHYIEIMDLSTTTIAVGDKVTVRLVSTGYRYYSDIEVTFTPAVVVGYIKDSDNLTPLEGTDLVLNDINITENYSDGTTKTVHPTKIEDYDKNGAVGVAQTVKAFYGNGENDYVTITVTPQAKSVTSIALNTEKTFKKDYIKGESLDLTNCEIVVSYDNGTSETMAVTEAMLSGYNLSEVGTQTVTITYEGATTTFQMVVAAATLESVAIEGTPAKTEYKYGESVTAENLQGATITATYSDGSTGAGIVITQEMISADLTTLGNVDVTINYNGKTATISVNVSDYITALVITPKNVESGKATLVYSAVTALDVVNAATYTLNMASGASVSADASKVTASAATPGLCTVTYTYTDGDDTVSAEQQYEIWYEMGSVKDHMVSDWEFASQNHNGYYRLIASMNFGGSELVPLGQQAYGRDSGGNSTYNPDDKNITWSTVATPFCGIFDGQGYAIQNYKITGTAWDATAFGRSLFGHIGTGGVVKNVILRQGEYDVKRPGLIATVNDGTISNVMIDDSCTCVMNSGANMEAVLINRATGVIDNVVTYLLADNSGEKKAIICSTNGGAITDSYVVNKFVAYTPSAWTGLDGWTMLENVGPVFGHYVVVDYIQEVVEGGTVTFHIYAGENTTFNCDYMQVWNGINKGTYPKYVEPGVYTVSLTGDLAAMTAGNTYTPGLRIDGKYYSVKLIVVAPSVTSAESLTESLTPFVGDELSLTDISIKLTYSNGTEKTVNPTKFEDYDKNGAVGVAQTVKAFYGDGETDYVTISVTLKAVTVESIQIDETSPYTSVYNVGDTLDLTGVKIAVSYNNGTSEVLNVTNEMVTASSYDMSAQGGYNVEVVYGGKSCTFAIVVQAADVTVQSIAIVGAPNKAVYKLNETVVASDLNGATITATNSDGSNTAGIAITADMLTYDFSQVGNADITVTYQEKTATISVSVVDYATAMTVNATQTTLSYSASLALDLVGAATYTLTMASGASNTADVSKVTASEGKAGHVTVTYTYTDDYATVSAEQEYDIWYEIMSATDWAVLTDNLSGYYRLGADIDFQVESNNLSAVVGVAPIIGTDSAAMDPSGIGRDPVATSTDANFNKLGVPFTGKFDGQGYTISNFKTNYADAAWQAQSMGLTMFANIGRGAEVKNFNVNRANVRTSLYGSFVAAYNAGTISNVKIFANSQVYSHYGAGAAVAAYNCGSVVNVVCEVAVYTHNDTKTTDLGIANNETGGTCANGYAASDITGKTNSELQAIADTLNTDNSGWVCVPNHGIYYGHYMVVDAPTKVAIDNTYTINVYSDRQVLIGFVYVWGADAYLDVDQTRQEEGIFTVTIPTTTAMTEGNTYAFGYSIDGKYTVIDTTIVAKEGL